MRLLVFGAMLLVAGCGPTASDPAPKASAPTGAQTRAALDPNLFFLKCVGEGSSIAKLPGAASSSDPANEEVYVKINIRDQTLQTWIANKWSDACFTEGRCNGTFTEAKLTYRSVLNEHDGAEVSNSSETWSISRGDGKYSHVDEIEQRTSGKSTLTRLVTVRGTCAKVDEPTSDQTL